ncbi:hypothetical protein H2203_002978 [Taxawa tesnikishii (nom. ined.)]|nr:hypothetical protein H2203_002978 [Dothideales sp. JES 119]
MAEKLEGMDRNSPRLENLLYQQLPNELWAYILAQIDDLAYLWLHCRLVSSKFRSLVDLIFASRYLQKVSVHFLLPTYKVDTSGGTGISLDDIDLSPVCSFERLSEDKQIAFFKVKPEAHFDANMRLAGVDQHNLKRSWHMAMRAYKRKVTEFPWTIQLDDRNCLFYEPPLKAFACDVEEGETQFDWKCMLQLFFLEHNNAERFAKHWKSDEYKAALSVRRDRKSAAHVERLIDCVWSRMVPTCCTQPALYGRIMARRDRYRQYYLKTKGTDLTEAKRFLDVESIIVQNLVDYEWMYESDLTSHTSRRRDSKV